MKFLCTILVALLPTFTFARNADSLRFAALGEKLAEYYDAMQREPLEVQKGECDFLIDTATDSLTRQFIALDVYRYYINSPLMGAENVAVHVYDKWFASGRVKMKSASELRDAQVYADFNRQSLIGEKAPQLTMQTPDGQSAGLFDKPAEQFSVLYFYDIDCPKCHLQTLALTALLNAHDYPIHLYPVYVSDNRQAWDMYIKEKMVIDGVEVTHLWDPSVESDFQRKYGVTQTPRMFLISPDGTIVGRGLDVAALEILLNEAFAPKILAYGSKESEGLFDGIFSMYDGKPGVAQVKGIADYISDKTLAVGDSLMFRQLAGDFLYYLSTRSGEGFKEGLKYHIDKNIHSQPSVWRSHDDSLKVVGFAGIMYDLLSKASVGSKVPSVKVPGELYTSRSVRNTSRKLDRLRGKENIIIFYTQGCEVCDAQKAAARALFARDDDAILTGQEHKSLGLKAFMVNVDLLMDENPALASQLMDSFDLSSLPYIIKTDARGVVLRRYMSL